MRNYMIWIMQGLQRNGSCTPKYATTNRMSPAGISYLYVASDRETAYKECRYKDATVMVAEYVLKEELTIIDFSQVAFVTTKSIFSEEYDYDLRWINNFLDAFIKEITSPVDDKKKIIPMNM